MVPHGDLITLHGIPHGITIAGTGHGTTEAITTGMAMVMVMDMEVIMVHTGTVIAMVTMMDSITVITPITDLLRVMQGMVIESQGLRIHPLWQEQKVQLAGKPTGIPRQTAELLIVLLQFRYRIELQEMPQLEVQIVQRTGLLPELQPERQIRDVRSPVLQTEM